MQKLKKSIKITKIRDFAGIGIAGEEMCIQKTET